MCRRGVHQRTGKPFTLTFRTRWGPNAFNERSVPHEFSHRGSSAYGRLGKCSPPFPGQAQACSCSRQRSARPPLTADLHPRRAGSERGRQSQPTPTGGAMFKNTFQSGFLSILCAPHRTAAPRGRVPWLRACAAALGRLRALTEPPGGRPPHEASRRRRRTPESAFCAPPPPLHPSPCTPPLVSGSPRPLFPAGAAGATRG